MNEERRDLEGKYAWPGGLYRVGGWASLLFLVLVLVPLVLIFAAPRPPETGGAALLEYVLEHQALYLTQLVCFVGLALPALIVFAALGLMLVAGNRTLAVIGALVGIVSEVVALSVTSSPQSLHPGLLLLAAEYAKAGPAAQASLAAAAEALAAAANSVTPAGILTALGILLLSLAGRRGGLSKFNSTLGILTGAAGLVLETLRPLVGMAYALYGLLLPVWFAAAGLALFRAAGEGKSGKTDSGAGVSG